MDSNAGPSSAESHLGKSKQDEEEEMNSVPLERNELSTKASMMIMMVEHDDTDDEDESPEELDQATLSSMCTLPAEIVLEERARQLSELSMKEALAEELFKFEISRMSLIAIHSAFSAAVSDESRPAKRKPNIFRRFVSCCCSCLGRRNR
ncbi:uncharacterized protein LOC134274290 [Saccostrea cucullata]|uniref:uncharacterized protein LOC134274290 n=1 Tax=Saccostrea cuccullata TaxID=36930 RepID=UPI002ED00867